MFYIAYKGRCSSCSDFAQLIEGESDGKISAQTIDSINDKFRGRVEESKPSLVEVEKGLVKNIYTGPAMSVQLLKLVGPKSSMKIFSLIAKNVSGNGVSRRFTLAGVAAAAGIALTGGSWSPAVAGEVSVSERLRVYSNVAKNRNFKIAIEKASIDGYSSQQSEYVVIKQDDGLLFFYFMEHMKDPRNRAAVISCLISEGKYDFSIEYVSGDLGKISEARSMGNLLNFSRPSGYSALPMGPGEYFGCIAFCVGANCGAQAMRCRVLVHMAAVLACMTAICGSKVRVCHNVCRNTW